MTAKIRGSLFLVALFAASTALAQWTPPENPRDPVSPVSSSRSSATDPVGDTFNPGPDLTGISAVTDGTTLTIQLTFDGTIVPPIGFATRGAGNEVVGFIDLDTDQQAGTGMLGGNVGSFCPEPPADFGVDYFVDLGNYDDQAGTVSISEAGVGPAGTAPITYTSNSLTVEIPNALINDDGIVDAATVIGNFADPTDCAPDGSVLTSTLGEPAAAVGVPATSALSLAILGMVLLLTGLVTRRIF